MAYRNIDVNSREVLGESDSLADILRYRSESESHETSPEVETQRLVDGEWVTEHDTKLTDDLRNELVAAIDAADLESPEQVADLVLSVAAESGREAALARLDECKRVDASK